MRLQALITLLCVQAAIAFTTGRYLLSAMIEDTSVVPPRQASGFPVVFTESRQTPNLPSTWEFYGGTHVHFAFPEPEAVPTKDHIMEIQFGTFDNMFVVVLECANKHPLLNWRNSQFNREDSYHWFSFAKMDLADCDTSSFTLSVNPTELNGPAYMLLSDIISVWKLGEIDANYGLGHYRIPAGNCYAPDANEDFAFLNTCDSWTCVGVVRDWDPSSDSLATPNVISGGVTGSENYDCSTIDFSWLGELDSIQDFQDPIIQADMWTQNDRVAAFPSTYDTGVDLADEAAVGNGGTLVDLDRDDSVGYLSGFPALLMYGAANDWRVAFTLLGGVITNFIRVYDAEYSQLDSVQVYNIPVDADIEDDVELYNNFHIYYQSSVDGCYKFPPSDPDIFWQSEPSVEYAFWTTCVNTGLATFTFDIPAEVATYNCPWLSLTVVDHDMERESLVWHVTDHSGRLFWLQLMDFAWRTSAIMEQTVSLWNVTSGEATLTVQTLPGTDNTMTKDLSFYPFIRMFNTLGACGAPVCEKLLAQYSPGEACSFASLTPEQRARVAINANPNTNCTQGVQSIAYMQAITAPAYIMSKGIRAEVLSWGGADFGVFTAYSEDDPASLEVLNIKPELDPRIAGSTVLLWQVDRSYADGSLADTPVQVKLYATMPIVEVLVFDGPESTGTRLETAGGELETDESGGYILTIPSGACVVAAYTNGIGFSPEDDGSDEALLGLLALIAVPFCCCALLLLGALWWLSRKPKAEPIPMMPMYYQPVETLYWAEAPAVTPVTYTVEPLVHQTAGFVNPMWAAQGLPPLAPATYF